jgi:predicted CoA-substrate-specific enzyme activase
MTKRSLGICIGASTISFVNAEDNGGKICILSASSIIHDGNPKKMLQEYFEKNDCSGLSVIVTGRKFKHLINTEMIPEPEAIEQSVRYLKLEGKYRCIASLGGENFIIYCLNEKGNIDTVLTGNKCASGTGEFFLQQIRRMNLSIDESLKLSRKDSPYVVSGRCSVFCKSDCTHALNKGIEKGHVVAGLCKMIADKTIELLSKQDSRQVVIIGGVSQNESVVSFIRDEYPDVYIPAEATYFEALGASIRGLQRESKLDTDNLFKSNVLNFSTLEPLDRNSSRVIFKTIQRSEAEAGDVCILGLDVGSTTTKAVIMRVKDNALLASVYLRTNGNPIQASIDCYKELKDQIKNPIRIIGLGTTGSGRHIAALHALTKGVINEIIAHAVAASYFDKDVDTIFEIGGQDAKYTHLTNGIASDYAMNEACSAGTGSFLEESAKETLNILYTDIGDIAFTAGSPLNFNDQCAAFISSDIKNASHEGTSKENIVAGLVYSICMNYVNRVKGNRPVGKKVFMQGGVCYNRAVPYAMSNLINKEIIVPPEPGLMGAFGVALEIKNRIDLGFLQESEFDLENLVNREFSYGKEFICAGGKEKCDRKCSIAIIEVEGKKYPFGGACSKYYNERNHIKIPTEKNDYVRIRQDLVFRKYVSHPAGNGKMIGISRSFLTNTLYPLYYNFFTKLGFKVVLADEIDPIGVDKIRSAFCYPVEIAHGLFQDLINKKVDYIFMPHITQMDSDDDHKYKRLCVFVQGENYYLKTSFDGKDVPKIISPIIDFSRSKETVSKVFVDIAKKLGAGNREAKDAFEYADNIFREMLDEFKVLGNQALKEVESDGEKFGMVLFGRSYNAFAKEANLNIPHKVASKNIVIIPHDLLTNENFGSYENMYWYSGQQILRSARYVKSHKQLFGVYITNFSCGPDSFIISYFRKIMGTKPSLTLELDSHSADVGIETRIDAAIDIIRNYIELSRRGIIRDEESDITSLKVTIEERRLIITDSEGVRHNLTSPEVEVLIPSMGRYSTEAFSAICRSLGINSKPLPIPTSTTLKYGRGLTTCKECLPFILTTGSLVEYIEKNKATGKKLLFFMPHGYGPCRQGQYFILLKDIIKKMQLKDVGVFSMDDEASFDDLGSDFFLKGWIALLIADLVHDAESALQTLAINKEDALQILENGWKNIIEEFSSGTKKDIYDELETFADSLSRIPLVKPLEEAKRVSLIGEIYVRREEFSRGDLVKTLTENGFVVRTAPIIEYLYYTNYLLKKGIIEGLSLKEKTQLIIKDNFQRRIEKKIKKIMEKSKLCGTDMVRIEKTIAYANDLVSEKLVGESILTTGLALREILDESCGVISIGPFNCMPSRLSEAILNKEMTLEGKYRNGKLEKNGYPEEFTTLPFLYVESDGNAFPQITQSKIEIFMMQAEKLHYAMRKKSEVN